MSITFRKATMDDALDLLKWKNELDTRMNSIVTDEEIKIDDHLIWLAKTLADRDVEFWIIEKDGEAIGDLRLNHRERESEISIRLDKRFRGKGVATEVIGMVNPGSIPKGRRLVAKIRAHNIASMRSFIVNGFRPERFIESPVSYYVFKKYS